MATIDLLHHEAIPLEVRRRMQALSFEAQTLATLGATTGARAKRMRELEAEAERLRVEVLPYLAKERTK